MCDGDSLAPATRATHASASPAPVDVSVVIVSWNTRALLRQCLASLEGTTTRRCCDVIVVDNGSADESAAMVRDDFAGCRLIQNQRNMGFAAACNRGIKTARGRYILLLNSDALVLPGAIDNCVAFAESHPEAGIIGCKVLNPDRSHQVSCMMFPDLANIAIPCFYLSRLLPQSRVFGREALTWWGYDEVREVDVVMGCFMLVRRQAIEQVGLLDEAFFVYGEEADWCYRMKQAGWKCLFYPGAEIVHVHGASTRLVQRQMSLQLAGSVLLFVRKHRGRAYYHLCCGMMVLFFAVRVVPSLLVAVCVRKRRSEMLARAAAYATGIWRLLCCGLPGLCVHGR